MAISKAKKRVYDAAYYLAHRTEFIARAEGWHRKNPERAKAGIIRRRLADPDRFRGWQRKYRAANLEKVRAAARQWARRNPDAVLAGIHRRRARKLGNGGSHTSQEWHDKCDLLGNVCIYCGEARRLTRDHKIPLARGGSDFITNIVPACWPCNSKKHTLTAAEFIALRVA